MQKIILILLAIVVLIPNISFAQEEIDKNNLPAVNLCRLFSKDLFDLNANAFLSPMVQIVNATSNAGFFHSAYIPSKVNKPYFRLSGNFMLGIVSDDMKKFEPKIPVKKYDPQEALKFISLGWPNFAIKDTAGLLNYMFQNILYMGVEVDSTIVSPKVSSTTIGGKGTVLILPPSTMEDLVEKHPLYKTILPFYPQLADSIKQIVGAVPTYLTLPSGGDLSTIAAGVPQLEIGSLFGTELLIRYIPKINLGQWVGKFSFWGIGLKHSISQYFYKDYYDNNIHSNSSGEQRSVVAPFDLAIQAVVQGTSLENTANSVTNAKLVANANIYDFNIHFSKNFNNWFEVYAGINYEFISIKGTYTYLLPMELQEQLGLVTVENPGTANPGKVIIDPPEYPGDNKPQISNVALSESQFKFIIGASKNIGPVTLYIDYNISKFNVFNGGVMYRF